MCVCVINFNSTQIRMMWHKTLTTQIQIMWHNVWENTKSTEKWQMGTMWHVTKITQFYLTKQNLLHTLFVQPTRQRVFCFEPWLFHAYNFEIVHDILFLLADDTIMYDAYSTPMMWFWVHFAYITRICWCGLFSYVTSELWRDRLWACFLHLP